MQSLVILEEVFHWLKFVLIYIQITLISPEDNNSDVLILSKGHAVPIIYASLNLMGKISDEELSTFREIDSRLQGHPHCLDIPKFMPALDH